MLLGSTSRWKGCQRHDLSVVTFTSQSPFGELSFFLGRTSYIVVVVVAAHPTGGCEEQPEKTCLFFCRDGKSPCNLCFMFQVLALLWSNTPNLQMIFHEFSIEKSIHRGFSLPRLIAEGYPRFSPWNNTFHYHVGLSSIQIQRLTPSNGPWKTSFLTWKPNDKWQCFTGWSIYAYVYTCIFKNNKNR